MALTSRILLVGLVWLLGTTRSESEPVSLVDDSGHNVRLDRPAKRIVSMTPHITETLAALGADDRIVGVLSSDDHRSLGRARIIGNGHAVDIEALISLRPDLIIAWGSGSRQMIDRLRKMRIPLFVTDPRKLSDIPKAVEQMGTLAGRSRQAAALAESLRERIKTLRTNYEARTPVRVFFQVWASPIITVGRSSILDDAITVCGGRSIFRDQPSTSPVVGVESVIVRDPDLILAAVLPSQRDDVLAQWTRRRHLKATRQGQVRTIDADSISKPSPAFIAGTEGLCRVIDNARRQKIDTP